MYEVDNRYLKFVDFRIFDLWDSKRYTAKKINSHFPIVELDKCITEQNKRFKIFEEEEKEFGILGVNNKDGIFDAYTEIGKNINQPYKKMEKGWLAYNPYRINVGSIGIKKEEHQYDYISPAYVVFNCLENLLPEFLFLIFKTEKFNKIINENTTGSVRQNLTFDTLKKIQIPLPSIAEQKAILDDYQQKIENAKQQETKAQILEQSIEKYLFEELGIDFGTKIRNKNILNTIDYSKIDRWSVDYLNKFSRLAFLSKIKYPVVKLRTIVNNFQYGLSEKAVLENIGLPMIRMNNIFNSELLLKDLKYLKNDIKFEKYILNKGDLLFNRTNSKELVGKTAVFNENERYTFASYLIRVVMNNDKSDVNYINYLFNSKILQIQKDMVSRQITGQANINSQEMLDFLFPLPPLEKQREIAKHISAIKDNIKSLKQNAETLKAEAEKEFEEKIFN